MAEPARRQLSERQVRSMITWFRQQVRFPKFELVITNEERLSKHGEVLYRPGRIPQMRLFSTGMTEETVIHELAHLLSPSKVKHEYVRSLGGWAYPAIQTKNGLWRKKPILSHGSKFKAAQDRLLKIWKARCPKY